MGLRVHVTNKRELKKQCYKILYKYHDFERKHPRKLILNVKEKDQFVILVLTNEIENLLLNSIGSLNMSDYPRVNKFIDRYAYFKKIVEINTSNNKPLRRSYIAKLLTSYTKAINEVINKNPTLTIDTQTWGNIYQLAVMVWDHRF